MSFSDVDEEAAILGPDRGELASVMEPLVLESGSRHRAGLQDLVVDLVQKSAGLRGSLPASLVPSLATLVRAMNCYYSNLIEGHDTHPVDIERALRSDYSQDTGKRNLQLEARAHIEVQQWIDTGGLTGRAATAAGLQEIHQRFCERLPEELLWAKDPNTGEEIHVVPGALRRRDVKVGQHLAISPGAVPRFLERFEAVYRPLGKMEAILALAAAHHRLVWIHPFLDGNGRVARLASHAILIDVLDTGSIWSVARGLARRAQEYKQHLASCDQPRRNDLDGRGALSEEALAAFTKFFLEVCIDQVRFMEGLMQPDRLRTRIRLWTEEEIRLGKLPQKAGALLDAVLYRGELPRGEAHDVLGMSERNARRVVSALLQVGVLTSDSPRTPLRLQFPAALASYWMPGLFPDKAS